jgi:hypothetical protein
MYGFKLNSAELEWVPMAVLYEYSNEALDCVKDENILDHRSDYQLVQNESGL